MLQIVYGFMLYDADASHKLALSELPHRMPGCSAPRLFVLWCRFVENNFVSPVFRVSWSLQLQPRGRSAWVLRRHLRCRRVHDIARYMLVGARLHEIQIALWRLEIADFELRRYNRLAFRSV